MLKKKNEKPLLYGLVLSGGKSTRMKSDKSLLQYHGTTQVEFAYGLLLPFCGKVFVSNRQEQSKLRAHQEFPQIHDLKEYQSIGPLGGILSAFAKFPKNHWLVLACDLPYVRRETIEYLLQKRNRRKIATAYRGSRDGLPEPLCAVYEAKAKTQLRKFFKQGIHCPRKIMIHSNVELIEPQDPKVLENINDRKEYKKAILSFSSLLK